MRGFEWMLSEYKRHKDQKQYNIKLRYGYGREVVVLVTICTETSSLLYFQWPYHFGGGTFSVESNGRVLNYCWQISVPKNKSRPFEDKVYSEGSVSRLKYIDTGKDVLLTLKVDSSGIVHHELWLEYVQEISSGLFRPCMNKGQLKFYMRYFA